MFDVDTEINVESCACGGSMTETNRVRWVYASKDNAELAARYDEWAEDYDTDLDRDFAWSGHVLAAEVLMKYTDPDVSIIDVGCGTGLCGGELQRWGYTRIDGFDLSEGMLALASKLGVYAQLKQAVLGEPLEYDTDAYGAAIATGVFTVGHAPASGWDEVVRIIRPGGYFVLTIRPDIFESNGYLQKEQDLVNSGQCELVEASDEIKMLPKGEPEAYHQIRVYRVLK